MSDLYFSETLQDLEVTVAGGRLTNDLTAEALRQKLAMRLRLFKGEWFLDRTEGTDYYGRILGQRKQIEVDSELTRAILTVEGVLGLTGPIQYKLNPRTRVLEVKFEVRYKLGTFAYTTTLPLVA